MFSLCDRYFLYCYNQSRFNQVGKPVGAFMTATWGHKLNFQGHTLKTVQMTGFIVVVPNKYINYRCEVWFCLCVRKTSERVHTSAEINPWHHWRCTLHVSQGLCCWCVVTRSVKYKIRVKNNFSDISSLVNIARGALQQVDRSGTDPYSAVCFVTAVRGEERELNCAACPGPTRNIDWCVNTCMDT